MVVATLAELKHGDRGLNPVISNFNLLLIANGKDKNRTAMVDFDENVVKSWFGTYAKLFKFIK